jgi:hypothetical protein
LQTASGTERGSRILLRRKQEVVGVNRFIKIVKGQIFDEYLVR